MLVRCAQWRNRIYASFLWPDFDQQSDDFHSGVIVFLLWHIKLLRVSAQANHVLPHCLFCFSQLLQFCRHLRLRSTDDWCQICLKCLWKTRVFSLVVIWMEKMQKNHSHRNFFFIIILKAFIVVAWLHLKPLKTALHTFLAIKPFSESNIDKRKKLSRLVNHEIFFLPPWTIWIFQWIIYWY